ncbi:RING finger domain-containing protein [Endozoicomonas sp. 4G]|uniref:RING finger domain-containing protein n=1 Tax=Endozoicomonas sp. 4G TaxID=2872754 RepID=UPI0020786E7D|nr:RING finger domain-containing protein [Endozoicomonas sp. 4G]
MERLLRSLFFVLPFMASVEAHIPDGLTAYPLPDQASAITESLVILGVLTLTVMHYSHEPKLTFPEYDLPDYRIFLKKQQAEMERIHKIAAEEMAMGRVKVKIAAETTDEDTARRVYIAKTKGITVREQKDIEQEAKRHREDAHVQSDGSAMEQLHLPVGSDLCRAATGKTCREVLSKIVSCANSEPDSTSENTNAPPQEGKQGAPRGHKRSHSGKDGSVAAEADSTTKDPEPSAKKQKLQQTDSESELAEDDPQQLLNQYLVGFEVMQTPADNFCWLHAIHLSTGQNVSTLIKTLIDMIDHHLPGNGQAQAAEHSAFLTNWITVQGEDNVQLVRQQLFDRDWPDFNILLPLLSYLLRRTFVVVNLHATGLTEDQVFTYATSNNVRVTIVSEASAIHTPEESVYLGLLSRDNHYVGIQPDTGDNNHAHSCPVCLEEFTKNRDIKSTSCFHYLCDECFKKVNRSPAWDCPMCRKRQEFIEPPKQEINEQEVNEQKFTSDSDSWSAYEQTHQPYQESRLLQCHHGSCDYRTALPASLKRHIQTHLAADQRPRKPKVHWCNHEGCNYNTNHKGNLKKHQQTHLQRHTQLSHPPTNQEPESKANNQPEKKGDKE